MFTSLFISGILSFILYIKSTTFLTLSLEPIYSRPTSFKTLSTVLFTVSDTVSSICCFNDCTPLSVIFGAIAFVDSFTVYISLGFIISFDVIDIKSVEKLSGITILAK